MKIQTIEYRRLKTGPGYTNETVGATAILEPDDIPVEVLNALRGWVNLQLGIREDIDALAQRTSDARWELERVNREIEQAKERWAKVFDFMERHNLTVPDEIPF